MVSGLYGYVSATKWLSTIELTTWDGTDGYWVPRGWSKKGPIKLTSRIDVPRSGASVTPGRTPIAGVAWRPATGISAVIDPHGRTVVRGGFGTEEALDATVRPSITWTPWQHRGAVLCAWLAIVAAAVPTLVAAIRSTPLDERKLP